MSFCPAGRVVSTNQLECVYMNATGGSESFSGNYKIHTFTTIGTTNFQITGINASNSVEYLLVASGALVIVKLDTVKEAAEEQVDYWLTLCR